MAYTAEISRRNPTCYLFLIDQSASMADQFVSGEASEKKADELAAAVNRLLRTLVLRCAKEEGVRDYFHVGVIGYGASVGPAFGGALAGRELIPISEIALNPTRVEERVKKVSDGAGGLVDQTVRFPVWFDPVANNGTPMCGALEQAHAVVKHWVEQHPNCFPPSVINITDGESGDGDPTSVAGRVRAVASNDGEVLIFNAHLSSTRATSFAYPGDEAALPDQHARMLYGISSVLPPHLVSAAQRYGYQLSPGARGFVFNADLVETINFLNIGTEPANMR